MFGKAYNLTAGLDPEIMSCAIPIVFNTIVAYVNAGVIGELHVSPKGEISRGKRKEFETIYARFRVNCERYEGSLDELMQKLNPNQDDILDVPQCLLDSIQPIYTIEKKTKHKGNIIDYVTKTPFAEPTKLPTFDLETPLGWQHMCLHTDDGREIQLWRPAKEDKWYDHDSTIQYCNKLALDDPTYEPLTEDLYVRPSKIATFPF